MARPKKYVDKGKPSQQVEKPVEENVVKTPQSDDVVVEFLYNVVLAGRLVDKGKRVSVNREFALLLVRDGLVRYCE